MRISSQTAWLVVLLVAAAHGAVPTGDDTGLQVATEQVLANPRYLHHRLLKPGMTGYGLTVLKGTKITRFRAEITAISTNFGPQKDVIWARLSGANLERTGVLHGMSGSPVYVRHEGHDKLIGAVAYAFPWEKDLPAGPLAGIQPIAQMLAVQTVDKAPAQTVRKATVARAAPLPDAWLKSALDGRKKDFLTHLNLPTTSPDSPRRAAGMRPLAIPLMTGGLDRRARAYLQNALADSGFLCIAAGGGSTAARDLSQGAVLAPGASVAIPLISGDMDAMAMGTVTDIVDGRVLALGHAMNAAGAVEYPMATAFVYEILPRVSEGVKLGGTGRMVGAIVGDETTGVVGHLGDEVSMIPLTIEVNWAQPPQRQTYRFELIRDRNLTGLMAISVAMETLWGTRSLPPDHTMEYDVRVDFGELGVYRTDNFTSQKDIAPVISDLARPVVLMANNPFGVVHPVSAEAHVRIRDTSRRAELLGVSLDRNAYAPGETVTATATLRALKGPRIRRAIEIRLPDDLPEGAYKLTVGDWEIALAARKKTRPRLFDPRNLPQLLRALQAAAETRMDRLYAVLELPGEDVAVDTLTVAEAPPTIAAALAAGRPLDVSSAARAVTAELEMDVAVNGSQELTVVVTKTPPRP